MMDREWIARTRSGFEPLIITCALNGGVQGREANEALPETAEQIVESARGAYEAGASILHVHVRDPDDLTQSTLDPAIVGAVNEAIRERCPGVIVNNTTGGGLTTTHAERIASLDVRPEMASLNVSPLMERFKLAERPAPLPNPKPEGSYDGCTIQTYSQVEELARGMLERGIKPELEIIHQGSLWVTEHLIGEELVRAPYVHQLVMGFQSGTPPTPRNLLDLHRELPAESIWFACALGPPQVQLTTLATLLGGHVRVGLEDNVYYARGRKLASNAEAVERSVRIAGDLNRPIATPDQAREILGLCR